MSAKVCFYGVHRFKRSSLWTIDTDPVLMYDYTVHKGVPERRDDSMSMYGYTRVSTPDQTHALQVDALRNVGIEEQNIYSDTITGAKTAEARPEFGRLLQVIGEGDVLCVWKLDRLGRSMVSVVQTVVSLTERHVILRSIQEGIDTSTALGRALVGILASLAELERENIIERVKAGMQAAKDRGKEIGRPRKVSKELGNIVNQYIQQGMSFDRIGRQMRIGKATAWRAHQLYLSEGGAACRG